MEKDDNVLFDDLTRREFIEAAAIVSVVAASAASTEAQTLATQAARTPCTLTVNAVSHKLSLDSRVTLLDLLREQLHLTGTKKGCDHGQCGACTVLVNGERINSCLSLAVCHEGDHITTIEGLSQGDQLDPMQTAFLEQDAFQCGFCTPGQICSAVAMLRESRNGMPSFVSPSSGPVELSEAEVRERLAGNICRCGAYPNIVSAVLAVHRGAKA
jgi:xanthine dehydrogenase YagT iron-sulfur-binding subunit